MSIKNTHKLPNSKNCFACGLENDHGLKLLFYADGEGGVVGEYTVPKHFEGFPGVAHGGIVATLLDEVISRAFLLEDPNRLMYTARLTTRIRKNVPIEQPLRLTARATRDRVRVGEVEAWIHGPDGDLLAEGEALLMASGEIDPPVLEELGWRVYPDEEPPA